MRYKVAERGLLFLFSLGIIMASLSVAVWLIVTGQAAYVDGLFLLLSCLVVALALGLYLKYLVKSAIELSAPVKTAAKATATAPEKLARAVPVAAGQTAAKTQ